jgi:hypothetical protein
MGTFAEKQTLITIYHLPTKESKLPFSVLPLQQTNRSCRFPLACFPYIYIKMTGYIYT